LLTHDQQAATQDSTGPARRPGITTMGLARQEAATQRR